MTASKPASTDLVTIEQWVRRAITVASTDELFA